jgi:hypothetical protein
MRIGDVDGFGVAKESTASPYDVTKIDGTAAEKVSAMRLKNS